MNTYYTLTAFMYDAIAVTRDGEAFIAAVETMDDATCDKSCVTIRVDEHGENITIQTVHDDSCRFMCARAFADNFAHMRKIIENDSVIRGNHRVLTHGTTCMYI